MQHKDFTDKLLELENKYDKQFNDVYEALNYLIKKDDSQTPERKKIGYKS
ncbi:hypothetical protein FNO01nite_07940 [Flavobacterium noncentrifugens]|nr:hypothetical protein FNO01nite_07940 [Flavobacterium noncentrifugens]